MRQLIHLRGLRESNCKEESVNSEVLLGESVRFVNQGEERVGHIVKVWSPTVVNLIVFADGTKPSEPVARIETSVPHISGSDGSFYWKLIYE